MRRTMRLTSLLQNDPLLRYNKKRVEELAVIQENHHRELTQHHLALRDAVIYGDTRTRLVILRIRTERLGRITVANEKEMDRLMDVIRHRSVVLARRVGFGSNILIPQLRNGNELVYDLFHPKALLRGVKDSVIHNFHHSLSTMSQLG